MIYTYKDSQEVAWLPHSTNRSGIEQNSENKSYYSISGDPKIVFEPDPNHKNNSLGPQKNKESPKN